MQKEYTHECEEFYGTHIFMIVIRVPLIFGGPPNQKLLLYEAISHASFD